MLYDDINKRIIQIILLFYVFETEIFSKHSDHKTWKTLWSTLRIKLELSVWAVELSKNKEVIGILNAADGKN